MPISLLLTAALAATSTAPAQQVEAATHASGVAFEELSVNHNEHAVAWLLASAEVQNRDPAALINLGAAYARLGRKDLALAAYRAAITSPDRYDLQLANGRWMDSRAAARLAAAALENDDKLVMR